MKIAKYFAFLTALSALAYLSFHITYENVSAIVLEEAKENKKNEIKIKPIVVYEDKKDESKEDVEGKKVLNVNTDNFIFIGDSRLSSDSSLYSKTGFKSVDFITTNNPDYYWMVNAGLDALNNILNSQPGNYNIVFNLGINDLNNVKMYIDFFNSLANRYPNQNIFVLSAGPLDEVKALENGISNIDNDDIYNFNVDIMKGLDKNIHMIHVFQEFINNGYDTVNGYYFTDDTCRSLYEFIWRQIKELQIN